jgi:hypothetical protein
VKTLARELALFAFFMIAAGFALRPLPFLDDGQVRRFNVPEEDSHGAER